MGVTPPRPDVENELAGIDDIARQPALGASNLVVEVKRSDGWRPVVRGVSLSLERGEITALVGESGCGKTMTGLSLVGLLPGSARRSAGRLNLDGRDITDVTERAMGEIRGRHISMVFQDPLAALNPVKRVGFQLTEPMVVHLKLTRREATERVLSMLEDVGLPREAEILARYPHELSGGMRQRVLIALALGCDPSVLIADEPTTALDVTIQAQVLELIRRLVRERNLAVLFVTHDLGVARQLADRIAVMYAGRIVETGPVTELLEQPAHPYTQGLLKCVPRVSRRQRPLPTMTGTAEDAWALSEGCRFAPRCPLVIDQCRRDEPSLARDDRRAALAACWMAGGEARPRP